MFVVTGGSYEGVNYSTMYYADDKYSDVSPNQKYYVHLGNIDEKEDKPQRYGILVFDMADKLVYAEEIENEAGNEEYSEYQHRKAKKLFEKLDWLR